MSEVIIYILIFLTGTLFGLVLSLNIMRLIVKLYKEGNLK